MNHLFGRIPDELYRDNFVSSLPVKHVPDRLVQQLQNVDVLLWQAKDTAQPNWKRQAQGIGSCVAWGLELAVTCLMWNMAAEGTIQFEAEGSTEALYGLLRVEVHGKPQMGYYEDGAAGSWGADAVREFGILLKKDYSAITGISDHNLLKYSAKKEQDWGYNGCGGKDDKGALDAIAKEKPVKDVTLIRNTDEMAAAISSRCTCSIASTIGFEGDRNSEGIIRRSGQWPHQMCVLACKYTPQGNRLFRIFNSWGASVKGPDPGIDDQAISECSWWCTDEDMQRVVKQDDSYAYTNIQGFPLNAYDFETGLLV